MQKFEMPITAPLGVLEQKKFGFTSFSLGGTSTPKMIKIGEMRVFSYLRPSWNALLYLNNGGRTDGPMDGPTNQRMDQWMD